MKKYKYEPVIEQPLIDWKKYKETHYQNGEACSPILRRIQNKIDRKKKNG